MRKLVLLITVLMTSIFFVNAQTVITRKRQINENAIVKDSAGIQYPYAVWKKMMQTGSYVLKAITPRSDSTAFVLVKVNEAEKNEMIAGMPKPAESLFFTTGQKIASFSARDIEGNKLKIKELEGKIVVLNFWFIGCPPCRQEIPELNRIALKYRNYPDVVFIAIGLDDRHDIKNFIKYNPFSYHQVEDGRMYADLYKIHLYPTNVVLDKEGKVRFHSSGFALNTPLWIMKAIDEAKAGGL